MTPVAPPLSVPALGPIEVLRRVLRYAAPFRTRFAIKLAIMLVSIFPLLLLPWPGKIVIDHVIEALPVVPEAYPFFIRPFLDALVGATPLQVLLWTVLAQLVLLLLVGALGASVREQDTADAYLASGHDTQTRTENEANAGFSLVGGLLGWLDFRFTIRLTQDLNHHYRTSLFERVHTLPMTAFDDERIGDAVYRVMIDTPSITTACHRILLTPIGSTVAIALAAAAMYFSVDRQPTLMLASLAMIPVALLATLPLAAQMRRRSLASRDAGSVTTSTAEEGIAQVLAVQSMGAGDQQRDHFDRDSWSSFGAYRAVVRTAMATFLVGFVPGAIVVGWALLHAADMVIGGELTRGHYLVIFTYFVQSAIAAVTLGALWFDLQGAAAGLERVFFLMDQPAERDADGARPFPGLRDALRFEHVRFRYPDGTPALDDVSFEARAGTLTAVVGPAGSGKTTLAHLAARFLEPTEGRVTLDGIDARHWTRDTLRARISYVFQETFLFDGSVAENLRLGAPQATDADLWRALEQARAADFVAQLPAQLATRVGRGGSQLSVGQRQRLSIARALVRDSDVLVFDEPTSALDPETEGALVESLHAAGRVRPRLVLVIAHRLTTIRTAHQILFLEDGRLVERGTHDELVARPGGAYRRFVELMGRGAE
jgi:ABC-type multidrug transport system fused ATPase/permease subunit